MLPSNVWMTHMEFWWMLPFMSVAENTIWVGFNLSRWLLSYITQWGRTDYLFYLFLVKLMSWRLASAYLHLQIFWWRCSARNYFTSLLFFCACFVLTCSLTVEVYIWVYIYICICFLYKSYNNCVFPTRLFQRNNLFYIIYLITS
jgi:hypothetical protein